jgi:hypothetical protein
MAPFYSARSGPGRSGAAPVEPFQPPDAYLLQVVRDGGWPTWRIHLMHSFLIEPIVALLAGILILIQPRLLNYVVAIYLILIGVLGLAPHFMH